MEILEGIDLLAGADELDRHTRHALHRQGGTATGVTVELRHDDAVEFERLVEGLGTPHRVLSGHRVDHEIDLVGAHGAIDLRELLHERLVDREAAGRVEDDDGDALLLGAGHAGTADGDRIGDPVRHMHRHADLPAEHRQLLDGRRSLQVGSHEHHASSLLLDPLRQLAAGGRLARALQAAKHQDGGLARLQVERVVHRPHEVDQFLVHDADELLGRIERLEHLRPHRIVDHPREKRLDDVIGDVRFQKRRADPREPLAHVRFGELAAAPQGVEGGRERGRERLKHDGSVMGKTGAGSIPGAEAISASAVRGQASLENRAGRVASWPRVLNLRNPCQGNGQVKNLPPRGPTPVVPSRPPRR